jgi:hypothetical protein
MPFIMLIMHGTLVHYTAHEMALNVKQNAPIWKLFNCYRNTKNKRGVSF